MVWQKQKTHEPAQYKILDIAEPGYGGLNIQDLDYTLPLNQSPKMLNMMLKNGVFGKRYGNSRVHYFGENILAMAEYADEMYVHIGTKLIKYDPDADVMETILEPVPVKKGTFINYNKFLYYLCNNHFYQYDGTTGSEVEPYCPDVCINRTPDGSHSDIIEDYNRLGAGYKNTFNGDGTSTQYTVMIPKEDDSDTRGLDSTHIKVEIDGVDYEEGDESGKIVSVNRTRGIITFNVAPSNGQNNVVITAYKTFTKYENSIKGCKYWAVYGGQNNSRLFVAGNGTSTYYFSDVFNAAYWPETNYAVVGNSEKDITGFGAQYNNLIVFKPTEIYAIGYQYGTDTTGEEKAMFFTTQINVDIGCDMPETIQFVDNRLTWGHTEYGILTLCSTVIEDERNVRVVSRNINGGYRANGLLSEPNLKDAKAIAFDGKYMVFCNTPASSEVVCSYEDDDGNTVNITDKGGHAYVWDYTNAPYSSSDRINVDTAAKNTAWFLWNNIWVTNGACMVFGRKFYHAQNNRLLIFDNSVMDEDREVITSVYQTPLMDFGAYHMLKTVKKAFFEIRGDTPGIHHIRYITDEDSDGEQDPENIVVPQTHSLWGQFSWRTFGWLIVNFAKTFARKCSVKKIMLFAIQLSNNEVARDMSISGIRCEYTLVKEIK
ncbi:MAG: hypothetical protein E7190_00355 [Erysipelotrichaceae bacterium]|nr:hypothetical protein [Erysipelotrichaceae bacterium]